MAGDSDFEEDQNALVESLIQALKVKIDEGVNLLNSSETCLN
jgi:hypothetical protein